MESPVVPVPWPHPFSGSLKPIENLFFELLAASGSFQERLGVPGIDSSCQEMVFLSIVDANLAPTCLPKPIKIA